MAGLLVCGALVGIGVWLVYLGLYPPRPALRDRIAQLEAPRSVSSDALIGWRAHGARIVLALASSPQDAATAADLAVCDRSRERLAVDQLTAAVAGACLPVLFATLVAAGGAVHVTPALVVAASAALGGAGFVTPPALLRADAGRRRDEFAQALSVYLDVVTILLAGGRGVESALWDAANTGSTWPFRRIRLALEAAQHQGRSAWSMLDDLADRLELPALRELTSSITLAGDSGARVRTSLTAKAASLRDRQLAEAHAAAERASEQMSLPVVALLLAFLLLIGYPAIANVLAL
jgi:Flp pilus assembly protein TadB